MSDQPHQNEQDATTHPAQDQLLDHAYDGIQEYDNPLPGWWSWMYIGSIVFAVFYFFLSVASQGALSPEGFFERAKVADLQKRFGTLGELKPDNDTILAYAVNEEWLPAGKATFESYCVSCHSADGSGKTGPNLIDAYWLYVKQPIDIADVIINGRNGGAMPGWGNQLHPNEIVLVSAYITSMQGKNLPGPRGQEGNAIEPWELPAPAAAPSAE